MFPMISSPEPSLFVDAPLNPISNLSFAPCLQICFSSHLVDMSVLVFS